jgi:uncharacterized membrane protein
LEGFFKLWTGYLATGVEAAAGLIIAFAAIQAAIRALPLFFRRGDNGQALQEPKTETICLRLGRWLALALEFELGADILHLCLVYNP